MPRFKTISYALVLIVSLLLLLNFYNYSSKFHSQSHIETLGEHESITDRVVAPVKQQASFNNYITKYPFFLDCKNDYNKLKTSEIINKPDDFNYKKPAATETHSERVLRGILLYFPISGIDHFESELRWLYRSWINMQKHEPSKWRTDLIIFVDKDSKFDKANFFFNQLNCSFTNKRTEATARSMCTLIDYKAVKDRKDSFLTAGKIENSGEEVYKHLISDVDIFNPNPTHLRTFMSLLKANLASYGYLDSILMAFEGYEYFKLAGYDFLIRSDMDVFLTPLFGKWMPRHCNDFYVGGGGYSNQFNMKRLKRVSKLLGLKYAEIWNLGSTWISTPHQFRLVSYLTLIGMSYLAKEEFSQPEREGKVGTTLWPDWHYGVLLLYGQHLFLNHLIGSNQLNIIKLPNLIDFPSGNSDSIFNMLHIHVFHGDSMFSKFSFKSGKYDTMTVDESQSQTVKYYALKMALEGKKLSCSELYNMFLNATSNKN